MDTGVPRVVFVVMSAVSRPETIDQLVRSLAPNLVLVHHDFSQQPRFPLSAPNARFVPEPRRTGWAVWGFTEAVFHSMRHALAHVDFDYLQLLSSTCLPIKPVRQFEQHAAGAQAHFDCVDLLADRDALMSVGYRAFTPEGSLRHRALRWLSGRHFGPSAGRRDVAGIWLRTGMDAGLLPRIAQGAVRAFSHPAIGRHPLDASLRPYYGSPWIGARRHVIQALVEQFARPEVQRHFSRLRIADEFIMATLLMQVVDPRHKGPMNHLIQRYEEAHVGEFSLQDLDALRRAPAWFARKFPDDPRAPVRQAVLRELVRAQPWPQPEAPPHPHAPPLTPEVSASAEG
jgi:hypothetical protein